MNVIAIVFDSEKDEVSLRSFAQSLSLLTPEVALIGREGVVVEITPSLPIFSRVQIVEKIRASLRFLGLDEGSSLSQSSCAATAVAFARHQVDTLDALPPEALRELREKLSRGFQEQPFYRQSSEPVRALSFRARRFWTKSFFHRQDENEKACIRWLVRAHFKASFYCARIKPRVIFLLVGKVLNVAIATLPRLSSSSVDPAGFSLGLATKKVLK